MDFDDISADDLKRMKRAWVGSTEAQKQEAESGQSGFVAFLKRAGLYVLAQKIIQMTWEAVKYLFSVVFG